MTPTDQSRNAPSDPVRWWHHLTTVEVAEMAERDPVAVLPLAAVEQHGPHLPLATDLEIGRGLLATAFRELGEDVPALALPPQPVGASSEHRDFPGTLSVAFPALEEMVVGVGASLARAGVRRLVILNSHGGNRPVLDTAGLRLRRDHGMLVVKASWFRFPHPAWVALPESEWDHGLHGGAVETAMMLHLRPELVREDEIRTFPSLGQEMATKLTHLRPEGPASFSWTARDLNPHGVTGDASLASAMMGERLLDHYGGYLAKVIRDARAFPLDRLAGPHTPEGADASGSFPPGGEG